MSASPPDSAGPLTAQQQCACRAEGNVLLIAGAGTGKTATLVERCLSLLLRAQDPVSLDQMLVVTFTEAAAAEMRNRLRLAIEKKGAEPERRAYLAEQRALLDVAQISTLHSFCLRLVRDHFSELGLDPRISILGPSEAAYLREAALRTVLRSHYSLATPLGDPLLQWIVQRGNGRPAALQWSVKALYEYSRTMAAPESWLAGQRDYYSEESAAVWERWLGGAIEEWSAGVAAVLRRQPGNSMAADLLRLLSPLSPGAPLETAGQVLVELQELWKSSNKEKKFLRADLVDFVEEAKFLASLCPRGGQRPLQEDWDWVRPQMLALLQLTGEFSAEFKALKQRHGVVDFNDLEQLSLQLLRGEGGVTVLARECRKQFKAILVDEYQDINPAQDALIAAVAREGAEGNRFLVGDVKQSIYRFRLADPRIFKSYAESWKAPAGQVIPLTENFRSYERILQFVNAFFADVMSPELGGTVYDAEAALKFGGRQSRADWSAEAQPQPRVELHLLVEPKEDATGPEDDGDEAEREEAAEEEIEARYVAEQLSLLRSRGFKVRDGGAERPVEWRDMVVLQRALAKKTEAYARAFLAADIPLTASLGGFYDRPEVQDLINLLKVLDNPLQDIPLLGLLSSAFGLFAAGDLARVRSAKKKVRFWEALQTFHRKGRTRIAGEEESIFAGRAGTWSKADRFLADYEKWRVWSRQLSVTQCLERILGSSLFEARLSAGKNAAQTLRNVQRFLQTARAFDEFQGQGLLSFLRYIEAQEQVEKDNQVPPCLVENAVRLMTIHQSKGLEFPVVVLADLGKSFNFQDLGQTFILDPNLGICPKVLPADSLQAYPSLAYWLAKKQQRLELAGEEMRLLYVAMTRARDWLLLTGMVRGKEKLGKWASREAGELPPARLKKASTPLDWLGPWVTHHLGSGSWISEPRGEADLFRWTLHALTQKNDSAPPERPALNLPSNDEPSAERLEAIRERLTFEYPFLASTRENAKTSVSRIRDAASAETEEAAVWPLLSTSLPREGGFRAASELPAREAGLAHHRFLELLSLDAVGSVEALEREADRIHQSGGLTPAERACLNLPALAAFWRSDLGEKVWRERASAHRELPFSCRFTPGELTALGAASPVPFDQEFFIVQGVIDLAVILPAEVWLIDFKTDLVEPGELPERVAVYKLQMALYSAALEKIYGRPVTQQWLHFLYLGQSVPWAARTATNLCEGRITTGP